MILNPLGQPWFWVVIGVFIGWALRDTKAEADERAAWEDHMQSLIKHGERVGEAWKGVVEGLRAQVRALQANQRHDDQLDAMEYAMAYLRRLRGIDDHTA